MYLNSVDQVDEIIANLVEQAKKQQLEDDVEAILARNRFVEI